MHCTFLSSIHNTTQRTHVPVLHLRPSSLSTQRVALLTPEATRKYMDSERREYDPCYRVPMPPTEHPARPDCFPGFLDPLRDNEHKANVPRMIKEPLSRNNRPLQRPWNRLSAAPPLPTALNARPATNDHTPPEEPTTTTAVTAAAARQRPRKHTPKSNASSPPRLQLPALPPTREGRLVEDEEDEGSRTSSEPPEASDSDWQESDDDSKLPPGFKAGRKKQQAKRTPAAPAAVPQGGEAAPPPEKKKIGRPRKTDGGARAPPKPKGKGNEHRKKVKLTWEDWMELGLHAIFLDSIGRAPLHKVKRRKEVSTFFLPSFFTLRFNDCTEVLYKTARIHCAHKHPPTPPPGSPRGHPHRHGVP